MNKPKSFTAWVVVTPHDGAQLDTIGRHKWRAIQCYECDYLGTWADAVKRGWRVRKIRCTFYDHK